MSNMHQLPFGVTPRTILIGAILVIWNAYWLAYAAELIQPQFLLNFVSLFFNAIFTLFILIACNSPIKRFSPHNALTTQEILVIYIMVVMVSTIGGHTMMTFLIGTLASFWAFLHLMYKVGALSVHGYIIGIGNEVFGRRLERWINNPIAPNIIGT